MLNPKQFFSLVMGGATCWFTSQASQNRATQQRCTTSSKTTLQRDTTSEPDEVSWQRLPLARFSRRGNERGGSTVRMEKPSPTTEKLDSGSILRRRGMSVLGSTHVETCSGHTNFHAWPLAIA